MHQIRQIDFQKCNFFQLQIPSSSLQFLKIYYSSGKDIKQERWVIVMVIANIWLENNDGFLVKRLPKGMHQIAQIYFQKWNFFSASQTPPCLCRHEMLRRCLVTDFTASWGKQARICPLVYEWVILGAKLVFVWVQFQIPSCTSLPNTNLSYPAYSYICFQIKHQSIWFQVGIEVNAISRLLWVLIGTVYFFRSHTYMLAGLGLHVFW